MEVKHVNFKKIRSSISESPSAAQCPSLEAHPKSLVLRSRRIGLECAFAIALSCASLGFSIGFAADSEWVNYKSGISLDFTGARGTDFAEEWFYYDKVLDDRRVIYIKAGTPISMSHNARNMAGNDDRTRTYESVGTDVGQIRYKVDGDQYRGNIMFGWHGYYSPISFSQMSYEFFGNPETTVVGATGPAGGDLTSANRSSRYYRGIEDSVGDEWHILTVLDDDSVRAPHPSYAASDGKIWYFVVNPKTPCATWRASGGGQFYTTPPKKYFFPIIYDQTTYFSGTVTCELRDINGNNVFYRINGGSFINSGSSVKVLTQDNFVDGPNTLEYYYAGNAAHTKTRTVVKNPAYPSAGETHGDRLWKSAALWESEVKPRINGDAKLTEWRNLFRTNDSWNRQSWITDGSRKGYRETADTAFVHALTARWEGMAFKETGYTHTAADLAKLALFDTRINLDLIGYESNSWDGSPMPSRELGEAGYYDVKYVYDAAAAYDVLIGYYRSDQGHANGITPVQDYFIRDVLARWTHYAGMTMAGYTPSRIPGMWPSAHNTGATLIACMMPNYSTPYYGTCGLNGNATVYPWTPFKTANYTWKELFLYRNTPVTSYPDCYWRAQPEDMFASSGVWQDRIAYTATHLYGNCIAMQYNLARLFAPGLNYPNIDKAMVAAAAGNLYGLNQGSIGDADPAYRAWIGLQNSFFPAFRDVARPRMLAISSDQQESLNKQALVARPFSVIWYNHALPFGGDASAPPPLSSPKPSVPQGLKVVNP